MKKYWVGIMVLSCLLVDWRLVEAQQASVLDEVIVEGVRENTFGSYQLRRQNVGNLEEKDILQAPVRQSTFTEKALNRFTSAGRGMIDALSLEASVRTRPGSMENSVQIRGISSHGFRWNLNGIPGMTHQMQMPYNFVDKVSIISGPSIGITGASTSMSTQAGGIVNMESKRATLSPLRNFALRWAERNYFSQSIDIGKRFSKDKSWGIRLNAMNAQGKLSVDGTDDKMRNIYVNIDHHTDKSDTNLLLGYDYDNQHGRSNTISLGKNILELPAVPRAKNNLSPHWSQDAYENYTVVLNHQQKIRDNLEIYFNAGYHKENYTSWLQQWSGRVLQNLNGDYTGVYTEMPVYHVTNYVGLGVKGKVYSSKFTHDYVVGIDKNWFARTRDNQVSAENKYPVTGNIYLNSFSPKPQIVWDKLTKQYSTQMTGWNIIDTVTFPNQKLLVTLGVHGHRAITNDQIKKVRVDASGYSPILGVVYRISPQVSIYANHLETFSEGSIVGDKYTNRGEILPPAKTKQNEIGIKWSKNNNVYVINAFDIRQSNAIEVLNKDGKTMRYVLDGQQRNRGVELSAVGKINSKLEMVFGASYIDAKQTKTKSGKDDGRRVNALPNWSSTLALEYHLQPKRDIWVRMNYMGNSLIRNSSSYQKAINIPGGVVWDAGIEFRFDRSGIPYALQISCTNIGDKAYWYSSGSNGIGVGAPRTWSIMLSGQF